MIDIKELTLRRGPKILLKETNFTVHESERVGLIGPNGAGKSSLFALISGQLEADKGQVFIPTHWRIAQVKQHINERERKAIDFVIDGDTHLRRLQEKRAQTQLKDGMQIAQLETDLAEAGAWSAQARAEQLLEGLGFYQNQWNKPIGSFSGGWQMRIALAQALMTPSDLLLLDEPTNHLDLDAMLWLERWLQSYQGTVLIISHDADFLDAICTSIIHFEGLELVKYRGNFSQFQQQYAEKARQAEAAQNKQQKRIAHLQKFIDRFRAQASKAKQAQSRLKAIERMQTLAPLAQEQSIQIHLPQPGFMPDPLLRINQATLGYQENNQEKVILDHVNVSLRAGSRIGVLGMNGAGKSTLIKSLAAHLPLLSGEHIAARQLKIGYFAQHQLEMLDAQASSLQHLQRIAPEATEQQLRSYLGRFGFSEEKATDTITYFSGGEKARLALALIVWQKPNLLLLDEPTNHLDMQTREALTNALLDYEGSVLLVSHDRHLLRQTVDEFWLVNQGAVLPFHGDLEDYKQWFFQQQTKRTNRPEGTKTYTTNISKTACSPTLSRREQRRLAAEKRQKAALLRRPIEKEIKRIEKLLDSKQSEHQSLLKTISDNKFYTPAYDKKRESILAKEGVLAKEIEALEEQWLAQQEKIEKINHSTQPP